MKRILFIINYSLFIIFLTGCGNGFIPVNGKVTFEDGSPVPKGGIAFSTIQFMAEGEIKPDGTYTLSSLKAGDGLPAGNYKVTVNSSETDDKERTVYLVDKVFGDITSTPLSAGVSSGQRKFDFTVSKPKKK